MAAGKPQNDHEEMQVRIEQAQREVLPAVKLEEKVIKMRGPLPVRAVPSIVMTTVENRKGHKDHISHDADRIVGISDLVQGSAMATTPALAAQVEKIENGNQIILSKPPPSPKLGSRLTIEETHSILEKTENLMEFFEDKKKSQNIIKQSSSKKRKTPSPCPARQSIGLDHLDNLVRLMEQLGNLRDENSRLKLRCDYLESTKTLLIAKSHLDEDAIAKSHLDEDETATTIYESNSLPRTKKSKSSVKSSHSDGGGIRIMRPRLSSSEDAQCIDIDLDNISSDQASQRGKGPLFKRSFSTGSLEMPSDIMEQSGEDEINTKRLLIHPFEEKISSKISKSPEGKRKSKFSKWAKVKKVLNKENISSGIKSIKGLGKGAYLRYGSTVSRELTVPSHSVAESKSVDSGVGSGLDGEMDIRKPTSATEPPSPTRFTERHIDVPTPQIDECMGIWLGPPEWIEKEREKEKELLKEKTSTGLSESPKSEPIEIGSPHSVSGYEEEGEKFLQIPISRRQSSPLLQESPDEEEYGDELKRISTKENEESFHKAEKGEKKHRTPWGKMKNIMHTRKDSKKKGKSGREGDSFIFEEVSETDMDVYDEMKYDYLEGPVSRSTPKTSPTVFRQKQRDKSASISPPGKRKIVSAARVTSTSSGSIDVSALLGGVSDEFTRKLQEWEEMKGKRSSGQFKETPEFSVSVSYESAGAVSPEFLKKLEDWERIKSLKGSTAPEKKFDSQIEQESESSSEEIEGITTPPDRPQQSVNISEIQLKLTDSFSRKMEEWEKQKYRKQASHTVESKEMSQKSISKERSKSKKTKEEKEREKLEKLREREIMRVEREEQKLEREKIRIEKERLKALEREAKIEKMKDRLSQPDMESKFKNPILSPLQEYKITADFARKLHEWEIRKGKELSTAMYLEAQKRSLQFSLEYQNATSMLSKGQDTGQDTTTDTDEQQMRKVSSESDEIFIMEESEKEEATKVKPKGEKPPPLTMIECFESPEPSPGSPLSDDSSLDDRTTDTTSSMTQANIISLEKANTSLLEELRQKEIEYNTLQEEVRVLNERLINFRNEHALELDLYKKQLLEHQSPGEISFDTRHISHTLTHLEEKIGELKKFGEQLAMSMEGAAVGKFQTVEGEESINNRLVDLLDKMRLLLQQATLNGENTLEEVSKKSSALHNFEKLYSQAMQLQMQMNNLRLSQLERNKEIMNMKRHLLLQEANNLLLQADVTRREAELLYYKEYSQRRTPIKRWNTYSGKEDRSRSLPGPELTEKHSLFQRVQRLRNARPLISSTTDSDSDDQMKAPPQHRESPRTRKRESPKVRKKDSPKLRQKETQSQKRESYSPLMRKKGLPKLQVLSLVPERCTDRREEYMRTDYTDVLQQSKTPMFTTTTLPTAKVLLPKDISPHEINGVPRKSRTDAVQIPQANAQMEPHLFEQIAITNVQTAKGTEPKFPELLIPEWRKHPDVLKKAHLQKTINIDLGNVCESGMEVSVPQKVSKEEAIVPVKAKFEEGIRLPVDRSFDSSETSEDTLKYLSPEPSPAPRAEPPRFLPEIKYLKQFAKEPVKPASDPGKSRPNSMIQVSVQSHGTPLLLRKQPESYHARDQCTRLHIPVIPLKRIKPAQELLESSQSYRSGNSIYLTRILKRYPMKIECRSRCIDEKRDVDKENIKQGYVKSMVKQLSREGTPDSKKSSPMISVRGIPSHSIQRTDSPKSEFVQNIVQKLSTSSGPTTSHKSNIPLKDLTNGVQVQKLKKAFSDSTNGIAEKTFSETVVIKCLISQDAPRSSSSTSNLTVSQLGTKTDSDDRAETNISSKMTYSSMPMLSLEDNSTMRERSSTTSSSSRGHTYSPISSPSQRHRVHVAVSMSPGKSRRVIEPSLSPVRMRRLTGTASPGRFRRVLELKPIEGVIEEPVESSVLFAQSQTSPLEIESVSKYSPKSKHKDKSKMGTIETLCRQSMTFDLGVTLQGQEGSGLVTGAGAQGTDTGCQILPIRHSTSSTTSVSSQGSEVEGAVGASGDKKKSKHKKFIEFKHKKFMDSAFIQKSRKFFKVSKENRCPSLECCRSDRELHMN